MDEQDKLKIGIGDKEIEKLETKDVVVQGVKIESVKKGEKVLGEKVVFLVKHPDREDLLHVSTMKYIKGDKVDTSGTWFNLDEDGKIRKGTALSLMLNHFEVENLEGLIGKTLPTDLDGGNYLCIKAY